VARRGDGGFFEVQGKSLREKGYMFIPKSKARLSSDRLIAVVLFTEGQEPELFLIPMTVWNTPDAVFVDHDYVDGKSKPEYGIHWSTKNRGRLESYRFDTVISRLDGLRSDSVAGA
jgi:hypothetical protein